MSGTGPYLESNQPFNPIPGLIAGGAFGAIGGATLGWAGTGVANKHIDRKKANDLKDINTRQLAINDIESERSANLRKFEEEKLRSRTFVPGGGSSSVKKIESEINKRAPVYDSTVSEHTKAIEGLKNKKYNSMTGGRRAGVIGGVALGAGLIGGTLGAIGNYD